MESHLDCCELGLFDVYFLVPAKVRCNREWSPALIACEVLNAVQDKYIHFTHHRTNERFLAGVYAFVDSQCRRSWELFRSIPVVSTNHSGCTGFATANLLLLQSLHSYSLFVESIELVLDVEGRGGSSSPRSAGLEAILNISSLS